MSDGLRSVAQWIAFARQTFAAASIGDPATDARTLVAGILKLSTTQLVTDGDREVKADEAGFLAAAIERRLRREPVHRILGARQFYGLEFTLSPGTLEPRPDTEVLVDHVLAHLNASGAQDRPIRLIDLGTGSGAIALSLLANLPQASAVGVDISEDALATASRNADINAVAERFSLLKSHWFKAVDGRFDVIVSNPPYIRSRVIDELEPEVRLFDPMAALDGGTDGLDAYREIAAKACDYLTADGIVAVEIGFDQRSDVVAIFENRGLVLVKSVMDYGGQDRALLFQLASR